MVQNVNNVKQINLYSIKLLKNVIVFRLISSIMGNVPYVFIN